MQGSFEGRVETLGELQPLEGEQNNVFLSEVPPNLSPSASGNVLGGAGAGTSLTTGSLNLILGTFTGNKLTIGEENVLLGAGAGRSMEVGVQNVMLGNNAGQETEGEANVFLGDSAGAHSKAASYCVFLGHEAGYKQEGEGLLSVGIGETPANYLIRGNMKEHELAFFGSNPVKRPKIGAGPAAAQPGKALVELGLVTE